MVSRDFLKRHKRVIALCSAAVVGIALLPVPAKAIFGGIVFDPSAYATLGHIWKEDISTGAKLLKTYNETVKIAQTDMQVYQMAVAMAQMLSHPQRAAMLSVAPAMIGNYTQNRYGETVNWPGAMNGSVGMSAGAWNRSTVALNMDPYLAAERLGASYLLAKLATAEQMDGASVQCTQILADYRSKQATNMGAVAALKAAGLDISKAVNSVVGQLNIQNAAEQQAMNERTFQTNMQTCLAQQQMLANKDRRDEAVETLNMYGDEDAIQSQSGAYMGPIGAQTGSYLIP